MAVIAIDAGTTMIKAVGYDADGTELIVVRQPTSISRPEAGWAEQDMNSVWDAVASCVRTVQEKLDSTIDFLAVTAQGDGCWLIDNAGEPTGPAILWNDGRAGPLVQEWAQRGVVQKAFQLNKSQTFAGLPNAILTWLSTNQPQRLADSLMFLTCGGWLFGRMTQEFAVDESDAAAPFMDIVTRRYSEELLALYDLSWAETLLPPIRRDDHRAAPLAERAATAMGLVAGTPVVLAPYDIASTAIGAGVTAPEQACCILGTTISTEIVAKMIPSPADTVGLTIPLGIPNAFLYALPTLAGGDVIEWACQALQVSTPHDLSELASSCAPGADGLFFLPYLSPAGERAPFLEAGARGAFLGLTVNHHREHLARAVFEGLTMMIRECLAASGATPSERRVCGGGAVNNFWRQLIADVTGIPVIRTTDSEVGARGAFLIGKVATGAATDMAKASSTFLSVRDTLTPNRKTADFYTLIYNDFIYLREASKQTWDRLTATRERLAQQNQSVDPTGSLTNPTAARLSTVTADLPARQQETEGVR